MGSARVSHTHTPRPRLCCSFAAPAPPGTCTGKRRCSMLKPLAEAGKRSTTTSASSALGLSMPRRRVREAPTRRLPKLRNGGREKWLRTSTTGPSSASSASSSPRRAAQRRRVGLAVELGSHSAAPEKKPAAMPEAEPQSGTGSSSPHGPGSASAPSPPQPPRLRSLVQMRPPANPRADPLRLAPSPRFSTNQRWAFYLNGPTSPGHERGAPARQREERPRSPRGAGKGDGQRQLGSAQELKSSSHVKKEIKSSKAKDFSK